MLLVRLKSKNQLTLPQAVVTRLNLRPNEFFQVDVRARAIRLIPVTIEPRYTQDELDAIDRLVEKEKVRAKAIKPGKEFAGYIKRLAR